MGITQQLDQCHSLGVNANYPQYMNNIQPSHNLLFQSSLINPFQSTRYVGPSSDPRISNGNEWTNYPLMSNINQQSTDPSASSNAMIDDNSLDTF